MQHNEDMRRYWNTLIGDMKDLSKVLAVTAKLGGTRPSWTKNNGKTEQMLLAWPQTSPLRTATIVSGESGGKLEYYTIFPFIEGIPNELRVEKTHAWKNNIEGEVGCAIGDSEDILWFYNPLFFRDNPVDLTEGVEQEFYMAGLCLGVRPALLDELTITSGPEYEAYLTAWLEKNPDKKRIDVPPLKINLVGQRILIPTGIASEYQARATIQKIETFGFGPEQGQIKIYRFAITLGQKNFINLMMYASEFALQKGYEPKEGDDVDLIFWLQGRIADSSPENDITAQGENPNEEKNDNSSVNEIKQ